MDRKIRLLYIGKDLNRPIFPAVSCFFNEVSKITDFYASSSSGSITEILSSVEFEPDFVYCHEYSPASRKYEPTITGLKQLTIPFAVQIGDLHLCVDERKKMLQEEGAKYIFTYCRDKFLEWYPEFKDCMIWMPFDVSTDVFKDYELEKDIDFLMTGNTHPKFYPLRAAVVNKFKNRQGFFERIHPTYHKMLYSPGQCLLGEKYAMELNRAKMCFTCDSIFQYPLLKYFEIPACNTLLLASFSSELRDLGFIPGENFVEIDENNFEEKADYYLKNEQERKQIALNGMKLVEQRHTTKIRARQFVKKIEDILEKGHS